MSLPPNIWGRYFWKTFHFASLGYAIHPTATDKQNFRNFVDGLQTLLPCNQCRYHIKLNLKVHPLTDEILSVKIKLILWVYHLHNMVNKVVNKKILPFEVAMVKLFTVDHGEDLETCEGHDHANHNHNTNDPNHVYVDPEAMTYDSIMAEYAQTRKISSDNGLFQLTDLYKVYDDEMEKQRKLDEDTKKGEENLKNFYSPEEIEQIKKNARDGKEKMAKMMEEMENKNLSKYIVDPIVSVNIEELVKNFMGAINAQPNEDDKRNIYSGLMLILECF